VYICTPMSPCSSAHAHLYPRIVLTVWKGLNREKGWPKMMKDPFFILYLFPDMCPHATFQNSKVCHLCRGRNCLLRPIEQARGNIDFITMYIAKAYLKVDPHARKVAKISIVKSTTLSLLCTRLGKVWVLFYFCG
jgi:hypothetical protein